jgi:hypothetical protein
MDNDLRKADRKILSYYLPVLDAVSIKTLGIMTDISKGGFRVDSQEPIPAGQVNYLRLDVSIDIAAQAYLMFTSRSKWCHPDYINPSIYNVGFEIIDIEHEDALIYQRVSEKYGLPSKRSD